MAVAAHLVAPNFVDALHAVAPCPNSLEVGHVFEIDLDCRHAAPIPAPTRCFCLTRHFADAQTEVDKTGELNLSNHRGKLAVVAG